MDVLAGCSGIARGSSLLAQGFSDANVGVDQHEDGGDDNDDGDDDDEPLSSFREGISLILSEPISIGPVGHNMWWGK